MYMHDVKELRPVTVPAGFSLVPVTADNVETVATFRTTKVADTFRCLLDGGNVGVYAMLGDKVVGHFWAMLCNEAHCRFWRGVDIERGEALLAWGNVDERYRGQSLFQSMGTFLCQRVR